MGKIKRERQKFHITSEHKENPQADPKKNPKYKSLPSDTVENIFAGINIQIDEINKFEELPLPSRQLVQNVDNVTQPGVIEITEKTSLRTEGNGIGSIKSEKHLTKKEKMTLKHQKLMQKLDVTQQARLKSKKNKQKHNTNVAKSNQLASNAEVFPLLTPAAVNPWRQPNEVPKNVFSLPTFNDDLPSLNPVFELKLNSTKVSSKSKSIAKPNTKKNFVNNYNFLKRAMAKKKK